MAHILLDLKIGGGDGDTRDSNNDFNGAIFILID